MRQILKGSTNISIDLYIKDDTAFTPETAVVWNSAGIDLKYRREGAATVDITEASLSALTDAHADGGFLAIGFGSYRLDVPDAAFATGASTVTIIGTVTGMIVDPVEIQLVDFDPEDAVRLGLTALPNANSDAPGGLPISDAGGLDLDTQLANANEITVARMGALTDWIDGGRLDLLIDAIKAVTDAIPDAGALTTIGTDTARLTAVRAAALTDWIDGGRLDLLIDAIKAITDRQGKFMIPGAVVAGTLTTTKMSTDLSVTITDQYTNRTLTFTSDTTSVGLRGVQAYITVTATNGDLTYSAIPLAPAATDTFEIT